MHEQDDETHLDNSGDIKEWSAKHDCAVAFLLCTPRGRARIFQEIPADVSCPHWYGHTEVPMRNGFADIVIERFNSERNKGYTAIVEVKTGQVIAGDVIRQLRCYQRAAQEMGSKSSSKPLGLNFYSYPTPPQLILAHVQPLSLSATLLLKSENVKTIDLGTFGDLETEIRNGLF